MKRLFILLTILVLALSLGCAKEAKIYEPEAPVEPAPDLADVTEEPADEPEAIDEEGIQEEPPTAVDSAYTSANDPGEPDSTDHSDDLGPIGNRLDGDLPETIEDNVDKDTLEVQLTQDKTMSEGDLTVNVGTTIAYKNYDSDGNHRIAIESGSGWDTERHASSGLMAKGQAWEYTFNEKGTFLARDLFSGKMRHYVTVQ